MCVTSNLYNMVTFDTMVFHRIASTNANEYYIIRDTNALKSAFLVQTGAYAFFDPKNALQYRRT